MEALQARGRANVKALRPKRRGHINETERQLDRRKHFDANGKEAGLADIFLIVLLLSED